MLLLSPSGELSQAMVIGALYSTAHPAPGSSPDRHLVRYSDGAEIEYDRANHRLRAVLPAGGAAEITAPDGVTITGDVMVEGEVTLNGGLDARGNISSDGNVEAGSNVKDRTGTMAAMRTTYNTHTHPLPTGVSSPPTQRMS